MRQSANLSKSVVSFSSRVVMKEAKSSGGTLRESLAMEETVYADMYWHNGRILQSVKSEKLYSSDALALCRRRCIYHGLCLPHNLIITIKTFWQLFYSPSI